MLRAGRGVNARQIKALRREFGLAAGLAALLLVAACTTVQQQQPAMIGGLPAVAPQIVITTVDLQGDWGLASFRNEADRERTMTEARNACSNPYKVAAGPNGGAMMYLPDQAQATEVVVKTDSSGRVFIGPPGPPATAQDRVVISYESNVLVSDWLDPSARERYGTMIFVRCGVA